MFGFDAIFVHGNMCAGLFQDDIFARLPPDYRATLEAAHGPIPFEPMPGRSMGVYAIAPTDVMADEEQLAEFLRRAVDCTAAMAPKEKKPRKAKAAKAKAGSRRRGALSARLRQTPPPSAGFAVCHLPRLFGRVRRKN
jgi:TfoX/Sxy family transcriptional regulator of competence genes